LVEAIAGVLAQRSQSFWCEALVAAGVPCGPVNSVREALCSDQARARGLVQTLDHPLRSALQAVVNPLKFSATPLGIPRAPPLLNADAAELIEQFGLQPTPTG